MSENPVVHSTCVIERRFAATPERVFAAYATAEAQAPWFAAPGALARGDYELDLRAGGRERSASVIGGGPKEGSLLEYEARYFDVVPQRRIVCAYEMRLDGTRISVSLCTTELTADGDGTLLTCTEQGAFLEGADGPAMREHGTRALLEALAARLEQPVPA